MESVASFEANNNDEEQVQEQNIAVEWRNGPLAIPEDDYKWKKYGQKFIVRIQKNRSYFKCGKKKCEARKKVEWPQNEPNNIEIMYEGEHNHRALVGNSQNEEAGSSANQYDLLTQMFGSNN